MISIIRRAVPEEISLDCKDMHPILARIYATRNVSSVDELRHNLAQLYPADQMKGMDVAVQLLSSVIQSNGRILVIGDFDADGATSTALAVQSLKLMGAQHVNYLVPNRFEYGYGLTPEIVEVARGYEPDLIVTVDNGISSIEGVRTAKKYGIKVLITDHHLAGNTLPEADAIVNPNQPGDNFPAKSLAGVGVIFYVMMALRSHLRAVNWFSQSNREEPNLAQLLDLVALGTVADVVPLEYNNRILVAQGLARIRSGHCCAGIRALIEISGREPHQIVASDLGFSLGPRINAAGRLEDMSLGIECLLSDSLAEARIMAKRLNELNIERKAIEGKMKAEALSSLDNMELNEESGLPIGLCLFNPDWHQGVIGILASRIKEKFHRPVIAFAPADNGEIKGSARSVSGLHIRDALDAIAKKHPEILNKFGGHAMAAGLSIKREHYETFAKLFDAEVRNHLSDDDLCSVIYSDGELGQEHFDLNTAELLRFAGPWGQGFPEPVFDGVFDVINRRVVGEKHLKLFLRVPDSEKLVDAIAFNYVDNDWSDDVNSVKLAYQLDINEFQGNRTVQIVVRQIMPVN